MCNIACKYAVFLVLCPILQVLELVANQIDDLEQLCADPPDLHHLGLGLNRISAIHDYITGAYW